MPDTPSRVRLLERQTTKIKTSNKSVSQQGKPTTRTGFKLMEVVNLEGIKWTGTNKTY